MQFDKAYFKGETREGFYIEEKMKHAWAAQLEVFDEIRRICVKHNLRFFADWGTLLGAIRHHGFIPWDDDLDVGMLRDDYMKFLEIAPKELDSVYELKSLYCDPGHDNVKARIINNRHMNFDKEFLQRFHACPFAVGIDIFPIDYIPRDKQKSDTQNQWINFAMEAAASVKAQPPYSDAEYDLAKKIENLTGFRIDYNNKLVHEFKKIVDEISSMYTAKDADEVCSMIDFAMGWDYHAKKEWYSDSIDMPFEMTTIPVPVGYEGILKIKYGAEYMTPRQNASSHDYPFYKEQELCLKDELEKEFNTTVSHEMVRELIDMKVEQSLAGE